MNITRFLLARLDEQESRANPLRYLPGKYGGEAVARRLLADCAAKRRIVELHQPEYAPATDWQGAHLSCSCNPTDEFLGTDWPCRTLLAVASVYADHPDYREEWRP